MSELITKTEFARRMGMKPPSVSKAIKRGLVKTTTRGLIRWPEAREVYLASRDPMRAETEAMRKVDAAPVDIADAESSVGNPGETRGAPVTAIGRARTAEISIRAQRQHLLLQQEKGELVRRDDVNRAAAGVVRTVQQTLLNSVPPRAAGALSAHFALDVGKAEAIIREEVRRGLADLSKLNGV